MNNTTLNYEVVENIITDYNLTAIDVLNLFTNYNGLQIMTDDFVEFVQKEYEA